MRNKWPTAHVKVQEALNGSKEGDFIWLKGVAHHEDKQLCPKNIAQLLKAEMTGDPRINRNMLNPLIPSTSSQGPRNSYRICETGRGPVSMLPSCLCDRIDCCPYSCSPTPALPSPNKKKPNMHFSTFLAVWCRDLTAVWPKRCK